MDFLKRLGRILTSGGQGEAPVYWVYVKCGRCGEKLRGRIDLRNDLSIEYGDGTSTYFTRKTLIGDQRCYQPIEIELTFDAHRQLSSREISGGEFIEEADYTQG